jgi:hypothetical protein
VTLVDPLNLKTDPEELRTADKAELQNGRLCMIAAAGSWPRELVDGNLNTSALKTLI